MEFLATLFGSILSGGASGLLGIAIQRFADYKNAELSMKLEQQRGEQELAKRKVDLEVTQSEYAGKLKIAQVEGETQENVSANQTFGLSLFKEPERYSGTKLTRNQQWVFVTLDALRGSIRPLLTIYLCGLTSYVWLQVATVLGTAKLDTVAALEVWKLVVGTILYLTTTCVLWWFGTRNKQKAPGVSG